MTTTPDFPPADPRIPPHQRLATIADQIIGMHSAGELNELPPATRDALCDLVPCLREIAQEIAPGRANQLPDHPTASALIINALQFATTDADLAKAWWTPRRCGWSFRQPSRPWW